MAVLVTSCYNNMVSTKSSIHALLLFLLLRIAAFAQSGGTNAQSVLSWKAPLGVPRLEPDPKAIEFAQRKSAQFSGGYSWTDLAEISLWASLANDSTSNVARNAESNLERIRAAAAELRASPELPADARAKAEYILGFMYKNFLKTYSLRQTRMDTLLANKTYNCVSSAVLYTIFCMASGLEVSGVMTKDHAFASVRVGGESVDVETTNPYGFDPGSRREFHDQFGRTTGFAYVPSRNYRDRQAITPIELVSLILSNRIAELETAGHFAEAVPLAVDRAALLESRVSSENEETPPFFEDPRQDVLNRIFNYGALLLKNGKEEDALRWAALAAPRYPEAQMDNASGVGAASPFEGKRWQEFVFAAVNNRVQKLGKAGQIGTARQFLENQKNMLNAANFALLDSQLTDAELVDRASKIQNAADGDSIIAAIEAARNAGRINAARGGELITFAVQKSAAALAAAPGRDWLAAIKYLENAVTRYGSNNELEQALRNYRANRAAEFHNRFAAAWNKRDFEAALRALNEGLAEFPDNRQLRADKQIADREIK
jgi:hypothetical protein